jgi:hypothetical protein
VTALGARGLWLVCVATLALVLAGLVATRREREARERSGRAAAKAALVGVPLS